MRIVLALLFVAGAGAQPPADSLAAAYTAAIEAAEAEASGGGLDRALELYAEAFQIAPPEPWHAYAAAGVAARHGRLGRSAGYLHQAAEAGFAYPGFAELDDALGPLRADGNLWTEVIDAFHREASRRHPAYDDALARTLTRIYVDDQRVRRRLGAAGWAHGFPLPDPVLAPIRAEMTVVDSVALQEVQAILGQHGWPGFSMVGEQGATAVFVVIQHAPLAVQERALPVLAAAVDAGEAQAGNLALLTDRVLVRNGHPQRYGTQWWNGPSGERVYYPLEDDSEARRAELGMGTFREQIEGAGRAWPVAFGYPPDE